MNKYINKKCIINEDEIIIKLEDLRDEYIYEFALGEIGTIYITKDCLFINPKFDPNLKIQELRNKKLYESFYEIFQEKHYESLSNKYYNKIISMINNKTLEQLGYSIMTEEEELKRIFKKR